MKEQLLYAKLLGRLSKVGLVLVIITFITYVAKLLPPKIHFSELSKYWSFPCEEYLRLAEIHNGWSWISLLGYGDFLPFLAISFLAIATIICYLAIIPVYLRRGDKIYGWLTIIEVMVLITAISGLLKV